jgi:hypothetical protein
MMKVSLTCEECGSSIDVTPSLDAKQAQCDICSHTQAVSFNQDHIDGHLKDCPSCSRKDFYKQKDFNRKIGVALFVIAAILSIWTYGLSFVVLYLFDFFLFKKLGHVAICYKCNTVFRDVANMAQIADFNHEMNDRIVYSDHDFGGETLEH